MIPDDIKDRILEATDLVALVSQTVQLKKSGPRYVGCCPFHAEKTPSFYVFPQQAHSNALAAVKEVMPLRF